MPSPSHVARTSWVPEQSASAYPSRDDLHADLTGFVRGEMEALARDGASYLQLDEGFNAYVNDEWRAKLLAEGRSVEDQLAKDIAADNRCYWMRCEHPVSRWRCTSVAEAG